MKYLTIRQLLFSLMLSGMVIAVVYSLVTYYYLREATVRAIQAESINRAYYVTKEMTGLDNRIADAYKAREEEMYRALDEAQTYFKVHGKDAPLDVLKIELMRERNGSIYDVFLINKRYTIYTTTYDLDLGLDFSILPKPYAVLHKVYNNLGMIDLSPIFNSGNTVDVRRYIVQRALNSDYMIQLGLTLDKEYIKQHAVLTLQRNVPTLLQSRAYQVFSSSSANFPVGQWWTFKPEEDVKKVDTEWGEDFKEFNTLIAPMMSGSTEFTSRKERYQYFLKLFEQEQYLEMHFSKDAQYIHRIVMPVLSRFDTYNESYSLMVMDFDESASQHTLVMMNVLMVLLWLFLLLLISVLIWLLRTRIIVPLSEIETKMKAQERVTILQTKDEVSSIARTYNQLVGDLHREIFSNKVILEQFKIFAGNAIHQIRTPLSVIKIALEMAESQNKEAEEQIKASLVSIEHMYDTLSYMVQHESMEYPLEKIDLSEVFNKRIKVFEVVAHANDIRFDIDIEPDVWVMMNPIEAEYLIDNNLSNAIKFGKEGKVVTLTLRRAESEVILSFLNFGKPIQNIETIFQRHVREDESKSGSGIGLNMVESICQRNKILVQVDYLHEQNQFTYYIEVL